VNAPTWAVGPLVAFDLETTGVDVETDRIVTASVVAIDGSTPRVRTWLADPGIEIPEGASAVHGITTEHARANGSPAQQVVIEVAHALCDAWSLGTPVVIYNASFDLTLLDRELRRYGYDGLPSIGPVIDPLVLDRLADPYRKGSRKLVDVARHYGVTLTAEDAHTSTGDCLAAARVAWHIAHRGPVGLLSLDDLQEQQRRGHAAWAANFQDYLRRQGKPDVIDPSWPIRPFVPADGGMFPAPDVAPASAGLL
jgi:DNA polymerase III subunit epsilon